MGMGKYHENSSIQKLQGKKQGKKVLHVAEDKIQISNKLYIIIEVTGIDYMYIICIGIILSTLILLKST